MTAGRHFPKPTQVSPLLMVNAALAVESTTPFFIWRGIFERLMSHTTLHKLRQASEAEAASTSSQTALRCSIAEFESPGLRPRTTRYSAVKAWAG